MPKQSRWPILSSAALAVFLFGGGTAGADGRPTRVDAPHLRPTSRAVQQLIDRSAQRSPTILRLMQDLDATDVIAYVEFTVASDVNTAATIFAAATPETRFVRIVINARLPVWTQVQMLGHELQHALEIAGDPTVVTSMGMRTLYERIGMPGMKPNQFETREAQAIQALVRRECASAPRNRQAVTARTTRDAPARTGGS